MSTTGTELLWSTVCDKKNKSRDAEKELKQVGDVQCNALLLHSRGRDMGGGGPHREARAPTFSPKQ